MNSSADSQPPAGTGPCVITAGGSVCVASVTSKTI